MKYKRLIALFPCENLEDFDLDRSEGDAEQLLAAWTILWHPLLLADQDDIPNWLPPSTPPHDPADCLIVVPDCCASLLPEGWTLDAERAGACVLRGMTDRRRMLEIALQHPTADGNLNDQAAPGGGDELAADFLALGYCHLQVELLNRKSRYMSNLDESSLRIAALAAARAAIDGNATEARDHLQAAFDRLHESREYFHPLEIRLLDLTLLAPTTIGDSFRKELPPGKDAVAGLPGSDCVNSLENTAGQAGSGTPSDRTTLQSNRTTSPSDRTTSPSDRTTLPSDKLATCPANLLAAGEVLDCMARDEPESLAALKKALEDGSAELIGGEYCEAPLPLLGPEAIDLLLARGLAAYERHLQLRPTVFGRRRFGLTPALPGILRRRGFAAAFHCTLDDGQFPVGSQARVQWEGFDSTHIDALCRVPMDAGRASSFLQLADKLADAMNIDQTPTLVFAHWPGGASRWYDDLRRCSAYSSVLGSFSSFSAYFDQTGFAGYQGRNNPDGYRSPYLVQDAAAERPDPISRWVRYFSRRAKLDARDALRTMTLCIAGGQARRRNDKSKSNGPQSDEQIDRLIEDARGGLAAEDALDKRIDRMLDEPLAVFVRSIGDSTSAERGRLAVNPCCFPQRSGAVEVPSLGFSWSSSRDDAAAAQPPKRLGLFRRKPPPPLADTNVLRNEFFEIQFDPATGAIRSISDYRHRDPRLAQRIALRLPGKRGANDEAHYSLMAADRLEVVSAGPALGEIVAAGRLVDGDGCRLADFKQTTRVRRGSRVIELLIELDVDRLPERNPWDSYYAVRFAWKDETLNCYRSANMANVPTELALLESPLFVDLRRERMRTTLLCGGLPYHRRFGTRKLDTLLIVRGETARSFRLGIGIDLPHPMPAALGFISPPLELLDRPQTAAPTGWLFHLDCRNVAATHWEPLSAADAADAAHNAAGKPIAAGAMPRGFRVRLLETDGRGVRAGLRCPHAVASAQFPAIDGSAPEQLAVAGDRVEIPLGPHQWAEVEVRFS